jgi:hypothetical protein
MSRTWLAHEDPDRPFDEWTWLDSCDRCRDALAREAGARPRRVLCIQTTTDRMYVTAAYLHEVVGGGADASLLCWVDGDMVLAVFVVTDDRLWPPARWRSLRYEETERDAGRTPRPLLVAPARARGAVRARLRRTA